MRNVKLIPFKPSMILALGECISSISCFNIQLSYGMTMRGWIEKYYIIYIHMMIRRK